MDRLDARILGVLLAGDPASPSFRPPFRSVARKLGVDENTVRKRLAKLRRSGFLREWLVAVNPTLLGQRVALVWLQVGRAARKAELLQQLALVDGVSLVLNYFGPALGLQIYYPDERALDRRLALISRIALASGLERREVTFPTSSTHLRRIDWRIIRSVERDPWKPYVDIAREVGVSSATVKRHLARLNRSKALYLLAEIDPRATAGTLMAHLFVFYEMPSQRVQVDDAILRELAEELAFAELDEPDLGFFALRVASLSRVRALQARVEQMPGVRRAKLELLEEIVPCPQVQESFIQRGASGREEPRRGGSTRHGTRETIEVAKGRLRDD